MDDVAHAVGVAEPGRIPERRPDDPGRFAADIHQRRPVDVNHLALPVEQRLILVAGLEDRAHLGFAGFQLRGSFRDALLEDFVHAAQVNLRLLGRGDIVGDADEADMLAGRIPARLRLRAQPAPFAVGAPVACLQHEGLERGLACNRFLQDVLQVVGMQYLAPVELDCFLIREPEEIDIGLVGEQPRAVELGHPHRHRGAVRDQAEPLLAFAQCRLRQHLIGDIEIGPDQAQRMAVAVAVDLADDADPPHLAVVWPDDPVYVGIVLAAALQGSEQVLYCPLAILGIDARDPIFIGLVSRFGRQAVDQKIFGGAAVLDAVAQVDF